LPHYDRNSNRDGAPGDPILARQTIYHDPKNGRLIYENHRPHEARELIESDIRLPGGELVLTFEFIQESVSEGMAWFSKTSVGIGRLSINGRVVGESRLTQTLGRVETGDGADTRRALAWLDRTSFAMSARGDDRILRQYGGCA
jgi:hypothetical protein